MIETSNSKRAQLANGFFQTGSGPTTILILGSCRTLHYANYLERWNNGSGNKLTILRIDPYDFHWNQRDELVDLEAALTACETDERILGALRRTDIFIHEHFAYYGLFNTNPGASKNIYQFGLKPHTDLCFPNWHDRFVLFNEQIHFDDQARALAQADGGELSIATINWMRHKGLGALDKFYAICRLGSFPEMAEHFRETWTRTRYFWTGNHVSRHFTLYLFRQINDRFLHLPLDDAFWNDAEQVNLFASPCAAVTRYDVEAYGLTWDAPIEPLKI